MAFFYYRRFLWRLYNEYFSAECSEAHWTQRHAAQNIALLGRAHRIQVIIGDSVVNSVNRQHLWRGDRIGENGVF